MRDNFHINFEELSSRRFEDSDNVTKWESYFPIKASITAIGYEFFDRYLINQSVFGLNGTLKIANETMAKNSTKQTEIFNGQLKIYRGQFWILCLTAFFSVASVVIATFTYEATVDASKVSDRIDQLKNTITKQNTQINALQTDLLKAKDQKRK